MSAAVSGGWTCCWLSWFLSAGKLTSGFGIRPFGALLWTRALPFPPVGRVMPSDLECSPTLLNKVFHAECVGRMSRTRGVIDGRAAWVRVAATAVPDVAEAAP